MDNPTDEGYSSGLEPVDLTIREPIGELVLTLEQDSLVVAPSRSFIHAIAERMANAETMMTGHAEMLDRWVTKARRAAESRLEQFFGEFPVHDCDVFLREARLHVRVRKVRTSFGPQSFDEKQARSFVRQFERARAGSA